MDWESIVDLYPFVKEIAKKLPGLRESIETSKTENPMLELQLETIKRITDLQKNMEINSYITSKLSNPNAETGDVLKARKWALEVYNAIHMEEQ